MVSAALDTPASFPLTVEIPGEKLGDILTDISGLTSIEDRLFTMVVLTRIAHS